MSQLQDLPQKDAKDPSSGNMDLGQRHDLGGDCAAVENRPAPHAHPAARNMINSSGAQATWRGLSKSPNSRVQAGFFRALFKP